MSKTSWRVEVERRMAFVKATADKLRRHGEPSIIVSEPGPPKTVERLRRRVLSGNWSGQVKDSTGDER